MGNLPDPQHPLDDAGDATTLPAQAPAELRNTLRDYVIMAGRAAAGAVPIVGGAITELIGFIPQQRQERVITFLVTLAQRMQALDRKFNTHNLMTVDLFESAVQQATRAIRPERNQYLVNLMKDCADVDATQYEVDKKILHVLTELTDKDIEVLKAHAHWSTTVVLERDWPQSRFLTAADRKLLDPKVKYEIESSQVSLGIHRAILLRLDLIHPGQTRQHIREVAGIPVIDTEQPMPAFEITTFGRLLLHRLFDEYFD